MIPQKRSKRLLKPNMVWLAIAFITTNVIFCQPEVIITKESALLFDRPDAQNGVIVKVLKKGEKLEYLDLAPGRFYKVSYEGRIGFVSKIEAELISQDSSSDFLVITVIEGNIRTDPENSSTIIKKCRRGEKYPIIGEVDTRWYKILVEGAYAYTRKSNGNSVQIGKMSSKFSAATGKRNVYGDLALPSIPIYIQNQKNLRKIPSAFLELPLGFQNTGLSSQAMYTVTIDQKNKDVAQRVQMISAMAVPVVAYWLLPTQSYQGMEILMAFAGSALGFGIGVAISPLNVSIWNSSGDVVMQNMVRSTHDFALANDFEEMLPDWIKLHNTAKQYDRELDLSFLESFRESSLSSLGATRGEFETTPMYQQRLKKEQFMRDQIESEYAQKKKQAEEEYRVEKIRLKREITNLTNAVQFNQGFDFTLSRYDADSKTFMVTIPALSLKREVLVPLNEAPTFKVNQANIVILQKLTPTLEGEWLSADKNIIAIDRISGSVIPWKDNEQSLAAEPNISRSMLAAELKIDEPSGDIFFDAEETAQLQVTIVNTGEGSAKDVRISLIQTGGPTLYTDVSKTIQLIEPGSKKVVSFQMIIPPGVTDGKATFKVSFIEHYGFEPDPIPFSIETRSLRAPELVLMDYGVVDQGKDGRVSRGEPAQITARIQNRGQGTARGVRVDVIDNPLKNIFLAPYSKKEFTLGDIPAGEARDVVFTVLTNNRVEDLVSVELKMGEKRPAFSVQGTIELEIEKPQVALKPLEFIGNDGTIPIAPLIPLTVDIEQNIPLSTKKNKNSLGIVFGIEDYRSVSQVTYAKRDASFAKEYFEKMIGIPAGRIYYRTDSEVGKAEFDKVFSKGGWLDKRLKKGETDIYFYYAGHGAPDLKENKAYLIPYDGDPNYAPQTGYNMEQLFKNLASLDAKSSTLFIDACFSGANRESEMLLADARPVFMEVQAGIPGNVTVFSAAGGKEISSAWPEKKHGLFSYFLMKGMRGDADINGDREITMGELGDYIKENVSEMAGMLDREQTPGLQTVDRGKVLVKY